MSSSQKLGDGLPANGDVSPWWLRWGKRQEWEDNLLKKAAHKTLDIPEDDMQINANKIGVGAWGLIGAALAGGIPAALVAWMLTRQPPPPPVTEQPGLPSVTIGVGSE